MNCEVCNKEIPEKRLLQGLSTCSRGCAISKTKRERLQDEDYRKAYSQKLSESRKTYLEKPEHRKELSDIVKRQWQNLEVRQKHSTSNKLFWETASEDFRKLHSKRVSKATKDWYELNCRNETYLSNLKSAVNKPEVKAHLKEVQQSPEYRQKLSKSIKKAYTNIEVRQKLSNSIKKAYDTKRNSGYYATEEWKATSSKIQHKIYSTKKKHGTCNTSKPEQYIKELLSQKFEEVLYQYASEQYPYNCDFYIPSLDLFIEYNGTWTHGYRPYNENDETCKEQLIQWQEKAKTSTYYKNAIYVWTVKDIEKLKVFKENKLNYKIFYNWDQFIEWYARL